MEATKFYGTLPILLENPRVSRGSKGMLDSWRARALCPEVWELACNALGYAMGSKITGYHSLWVLAMEPSEQSDDSAVIEISGEGLATVGERRQRKIRCGEMQISVGPLEKVVLVWNTDETGRDGETGDPVDEPPRRITKLDTAGEPVLRSITTPSGVATRWLVSEAEVTIVDTYYQLTSPTMATVGTAVTPVSPPTVPPYLWASYSEPLRSRFPDGWVLVEREVEEIASVSDSDGLWRVIDTIAFRQPAFPE